MKRLLVLLLLPVATFSQGPTLSVLHSQTWKGIGSHPSVAVKAHNWPEDAQGVFSFDGHNDGS
jgi:hypothetical protein